MTGEVSASNSNSLLRIRTYPWRCAEIQRDPALLEEAILLVELNELEGGTSAVPLLLGELVPLVETALAVLLLDRHGAGSLVAIDPSLAMLDGALVPTAWTRRRFTPEIFGG
jgi:hypothetical protein